MFTFSLILAKLTHYLIKAFKLGAGYTWPGYIASLVYPNILKEYQNRYRVRYILVSGTNGKSTTTKLITHLLTHAGKKVLHNSSGANLSTGILSALLINTSLKTGLHYDYVALEVDEGTLPEILTIIDPSTLVLLNLSRDQLDRYGETDIILDKWVSSLSGKKNIKVVLDATKENLQRIAKIYTGPLFYFDDNKSLLEKSHLVGDFNALNINAASMAVSLEGISSNTIQNHLRTFSVAFGRGEKIDYHDKIFHIFLAKNPTSLSNNLALIKDPSYTYEGIIFVLNDEVRDGRDVSWIYDVVSADIFAVCQDKKVAVTGTRCHDMAARLMYAGVPTDKIFVQESLQKSINTLVADEKLKDIIVLPNYSAMLQVRKILTGKEIL